MPGWKLSVAAIVACVLLCDPLLAWSCTCQGVSLDDRDHLVDRYAAVAVGTLVDLDPSNGDAVIEATTIWTPKGVRSGDVAVRFDIDSDCQIGYELKVGAIYVVGLDAPGPRHGRHTTNGCDLGASVAPSELTEVEDKIRAL